MQSVTYLLCNSITQIMSSKCHRLRTIMMLKEYTNLLSGPQCRLTPLPLSHTSWKSAYIRLQIHHQVTMDKLQTLTSWAASVHIYQLLCSVQQYALKYTVTHKINTQQTSKTFHSYIQHEATATCMLTCHTRACNLKLPYHSATKFNAQLLLLQCKIVLHNIHTTVQP